MNVPAFPVNDKNCLRDSQVLRNTSSPGSGGRLRSVTDGDGYLSRLPGLCFMQCHKICDGKTADRIGVVVQDFVQHACAAADAE